MVQCSSIPSIARSVEGVMDVHECSRRYSIISGGVKTGRHAKAGKRMRTETVASDDSRLNERR
jgi:hypothetical protein